MNIIVDADACPGVKLITDIAIKYNIKLTLYNDNTHNIESDYADVITLSKGFQSVDMVIANDIKNGDILITHVLHPKGMIYTNDNIDNLLYERHLNSKLRKSGKHTKGPRKRTKEDDQNLVNSLEILINKER